ncbi:MAG: DNA-formamidopyrimidine glycosylase family protein [Acidobacteriota bacterium]
MPELSEVDLLVTRLNARLRVMAAQPIFISGRATHPRFTEMWAACAPQLINTQLTRISRKGKYLIFELAEGRGLLLAHLRMTGWWAWQQIPQTLTVAQGYSLDRHPKLFLDMQWPDSSREQLIYYDSRGLGEFSYYAQTDWRQLPPLAAQAPDFIATENSLPGGFLQNEEEFLVLVRAQKTRATKRSIRDVLMDQSHQGVGAGLGNYLIAEVLYRAGVHPDRGFCALHLTTLKKIYQITCDLFRHVIAHEADAEATMVVYQREQCPRGHQIKRDVRGARSSYYCPRCQR